MLHRLTHSKDEGFSNGPGEFKGRRIRVGIDAMDGRSQNEEKRWQPPEGPVAGVAHRCRRQGSLA